MSIPRIDLPNRPENMTTGDYFDEFRLRVLNQVDRRSEKLAESGGSDQYIARYAFLLVIEDCKDKPRIHLESHRNFLSEKCREVCGQIDNEIPLGKEGEATIVLALGETLGIVRSWINSRKQEDLEQFTPELKSGRTEELIQLERDQGRISWALEMMGYSDVNQLVNYLEVKGNDKVKRIYESKDESGDTFLLPNDIVADLDNLKQQPSVVVYQETPKKEAELAIVEVGRKDIAPKYRQIYDLITNKNDVRTIARKIREGLSSEEKLSIVDKKTLRAALLEIEEKGLGIFKNKKEVWKSALNVWADGLKQDEEYPSTVNGIRTLVDRYKSLLD